MTVSFGLLGTLRVVGPDGELVVGAPRQRALLAALLLAGGRTVGSDELIEQVWNQRPTGGATATLHSYLSRLRKVLGPAGDRIVTSGAGYLVRVEPGELDLDRFADHRERARRPRQSGDAGVAEFEYRAALALWRGAPLADVPEMPWREDAVRYWTEQHTLTVEDHLAVEAELRPPAEIVPQLRAFVREHPLREESAARLLAALAQAGRRSEALMEYQRVRKALIEEAGIEPGEALRSVHQRLLSEELSAEVPPVPERPVPGQLPPPLADFVGRADEVQRAEAVATAPGETPAVLVVSGPGGIGKTSFAVQLAHRLRSRFPDGQIYVRLGGLRAPRAAAELAAEVLRALGVAGPDLPSGVDERSALLRSMLAERRVLLVLDDAAESGQIRPLLPGTAASTVIVTSRSRLPGLTGQTPVELPALPEAESRALLNRLAGPDRTAQEPHALADVLQACAGLPLALRICGARLALRRTWTIASLADRLRDADHRLDELTTEDLAVRACLNESYHALRPRDPVGDHGDHGHHDPALSFRLLSLLGGDQFSLAAAAALLGTDERAADRVAEHLVGLNLLDAVGPTRFAFHPLVRELAREHCANTDPAKVQHEAIRGWARWYLTTATAADQLINPERIPTAWEGWIPGPDPDRIPFGDRQGALDWFDLESAGLVDAVTGAADSGDAEVAAALALAILYGFRVRGRIGELEAVHEAALAVAERLDQPEVHGLLLNNLAIIHGSTGRFPEAVAAFESAIPLFQRAARPEREAQARINVAITFQRLGDSARAAELLTEARDRLRELEGTDAWGPVTALSVSTSSLALGTALNDLGRADEAATVFTELIAHAGAHGHATLLPLAWSNLANVESARGHYDVALPMVQTSLELQRAGGNRDGEAYSLWVLGEVHLGLGDREAARSVWEEACRIYTDLGQTRDLALLGAQLAELDEAEPA